MAAMAFIFKAVALLLATTFSAAAATWCVVRSDASEQVMQRALDYACSGGADCAPIRSSGLCYLPNTLQAHTSYAINSYYQRRGNAPDACYFGGAAAIAATDPSYGSCVYPSSPSNAGGTVGRPSGATTPSVTSSVTEAPPPPSVTSSVTEAPPPPRTTTTPLYGGGGMGTIVADPPTSNDSIYLLKRGFYITYVVFWLVF